MANNPRESPKEVQLPTRLPLIGIANQRGADADRDSRLINGYIERGVDGVIRIVKRPGLGVGTTILEGISILGLGMFQNYTIFRSPVEGGKSARLYNSTTFIGVVKAVPDGGFIGNFSFEEASSGVEATTLVFHDTSTVHTYNATDGLKRLPLRGETYGPITCGITNTLEEVTTADTSVLTEYSGVTGTGIQADTVIVSIDSATQFTMSLPATATNASAALSFTLGGPPSRESTQGVKTWGGSLPTYPSLAWGVSELNKRTYLFTYRSEVVGSDIDEPRAWNPLNSIYAYADQDPPIAIAKQLSYVIAFKARTTEFFRDAGGTPAPLERLENLRLDVGCYAGPTVQEINGTLLWVSDTASRIRSVWTLAGMKPTEVAWPSIKRILSRYTPTRAISFSLDGHVFYAVTATLDDETITLVYDLTSEFWSYWSALGETYMPFSGAYSQASQVTFQHESNGKTYIMSNDYRADAGVSFDMDVYPPEFDGGLRVTKHLSKMHIVADQEESSTLQVRVSDDNRLASTWSNFRTIDLSSPRPTLDQCGSFYKRAFHFRHSSQTACRLEAVELELLPGLL